MVTVLEELQVDYWIKLPFAQANSILDENPSDISLEHFMPLVFVPSVHIIQFFYDLFIKDIKMM